ncbi:Nucleoside diphosphate-linked moiety X motif 13 [Bienertia sinuspersici]
MVSKKRRQPTPKLPSIVETPPVGPPLEFLNTEDDAWYSVQLVLVGQTLIVKYTEFQDEKDLQFHAQDFNSSHEISSFKNRFRRLSLQLDASDCSMVQVGMRVCALSVHSDVDRRFYDAIVEAVKHEEHIFVDETEDCPCTVVLSWLQGPKTGTLTTARVEDLCPIHSQEYLDPRVACFLALAKWKHGIASPCSKMITEDTCYGEIPLSFQCKLQSKPEGGKQMQSALPSDEESFGYERNEDVDLGGGDQHKQTDDHYLNDLDKPVNDANSGERDIMKTKNPDIEARCFIVVENLEKDVSPSTIVGFVKEETGLEVEAFVFLSLSSEPYTRGALVVDCVGDLERLCNFLVKPGQMITSLKGRPWVMSNALATEMVRPSFWCLEPNCKDERQQSAGDGLKIVQLGSEEYSNAEKLRDLFLAFAHHQQLLLERLALEEQRIFDS